MSPRHNVIDDTDDMTSDETDDVAETDDRAETRMCSLQQDYEMTIQAQKQ